MLAELVHAAFCKWRDQDKHLVRAGVRVLRAQVGVEEGEEFIYWCQSQGGSGTEGKEKLPVDEAGARCGGGAPQGGAAGGRRWLAGRGGSLPEWFSTE